MYGQINFITQSSRICGVWHKAAEKIIHKEGSLILKNFRLIKYQDTAYFCYKKEIIRLCESLQRINPLLSNFWACKQFQGKVK